MGSAHLGCLGIVDDLEYKRSVPLSVELKPNTACKVAKREMFLLSVPSTLKPDSKPAAYGKATQSHVSFIDFHCLPERRLTYMKSMAGSQLSSKQIPTWVPLCISQNHFATKLMYTVVRVGQNICLPEKPCNSSDFNK